MGKWKLVDAVLGHAAASDPAWVAAGVSWFEVDRSDVLNAKKRVLSRAEASFSADTNQGAHKSPTAFTKAMSFKDVACYHVQDCKS